MNTEIIETGHQCRCPRCKAIVPRGARRDDSQWVAICEPCGHPLLEDIEQPPKAPMTEGTLVALRPFSEDADQALLARLEAARGGRTYRSFFRDLGLESAQVRIIGPLRKGMITDHYRRLLEDALDRHEKKEAPVKKTMYEELVKAIESAKARMGLKESELCRRLGKGPAYLANAKTYARDGSGISRKKLDEIISALNSLQPDPAPKVKRPSVFLPTDPANLAAHRAANEAEGKSRQDTNATPPVKKEALDLLEDVLGIDVRELAHIKPQLEMLIVARRNGIKARVIVDPVELA